MSLIKYIFFIVIYLIYTIILLSIAKSLSRALEITLNKIISRILLSLLGVYSIKYKNKQKENKKVPNIIFSSQSTVIDWLVLLYNYSPRFLAIVKSEDNKSDFLIELSSSELFSYSLGLKFPTTKTINQKRKFNIEDYVVQPKTKPLVIFPECTKTNRYGVLKIRSNIFDDFYRFVNEHEKLFARSDICINSNGDYNTTDEKGFSSLFGLCQRNYTSIEIYSRDIQNEAFNLKDSEFDRKKFSSLQLYLDYNLQEYLMELNHRNAVSLSVFDHVKFLDYYHKTQDSLYTKKK